MPETVLQWVALLASIVMLVFLIGNVLGLWVNILRNPIVRRLNDIEHRVEEGVQAGNRSVYDIRSVKRQIKEQEDATLAIVSYLIERDGTEAAEALMRHPKVQNGKPVPVVTRFDTGVMYNLIPDEWVERDIPRPAVCPPDQSPPEMEEEEEDPQVAILRHQRELDEWDAALMRQMLYGDDGDE